MSCGTRKTGMMIDAEVARLRKENPAMPIADCQRRAAKNVMLKEKAEKAKDSSQISPVKARTADNMIVFSMLTCSGEASFSSTFTRLLQQTLGEQIAVRVTDRWQAEEILGLVSRESFNLIVPCINNIKYSGDRDEWPIKVVELLRRLKSQFAAPIIACCTRGIPGTQDLPNQLKEVGVDAFVWTPFTSADVMDALGVCLKDQANNVEAPSPSDLMRIRARECLQRIEEARRRSIRIVPGWGVTYSTLALCNPGASPTRRIEGEKQLDTPPV